MSASRFETMNDDDMDVDDGVSTVLRWVDSGVAVQFWSFK